MSVNRREAIREYKEAVRPAGVYRVRNRLSGRSLVGASSDLPSMLNRQRAQLRFHGHGCRELQRDWDEAGEESFEFEVLDEIESRDDGSADLRDELKQLEDLWRDKLAAEGEELYEFRGSIR